MGRARVMQRPRRTDVQTTAHRSPPPMKLIPASASALRWLSQTSPVDLTAHIDALAASVVRLVPSCVGVSLTILDQDLTFTLVASDREPSGGRTHAHPPEGSRAPDRASGEQALDESLWLSDALTTAAPGVRTTLTLPVTSQGRLDGSLQVYATDPDAFVSATPALQRLAGTCASAPITNSDLAFTSRQRAEHAPAILENSAIIDRAVGRLVAAHSLDLCAARSRLYDAAAREGMSVPDVARAVVDGRVWGV